MNKYKNDERISKVSKLSELIAVLQSLLAEHGDLPVNTYEDYTGWHDESPAVVAVDLVDNHLDPVYEDRPVKNIAADKFVGLR